MKINRWQFRFTFLSRGDELRERLGEIAPLPDCQDYGIHSDGYSFTPLQGKSGRTVEVEELAIWIRSDKDFDPTKPIRLLACSSGKYDDGAAARLAEILGVEVIAPEGDLYVNFKGE